MAPTHLFTNFSPPHVWCRSSATTGRFGGVLHGAVRVWRAADNTAILVQRNLRASSRLWRLRIRCTLSNGNEPAFAFIAHGLQKFGQLRRFFSRCFRFIQDANHLCVGSAWRLPSRSVWTREADIRHPTDLICGFLAVLRPARPQRPATPRNARRLARWRRPPPQPRTP
jgi:hypothetical protein